MKSITARVSDSGHFEVQIMFLNFRFAFKMKSVNIHQPKFLLITNLTHFFYIYLFHLSTCFEHHSTHHQEIELY